jgi:hypothetical protein
MMEWPGGTVSKEDVGEDTSGKRSNKRRRDDDADEEARCLRVTIQVSRFGGGPEIEVFDHLIFF